MDLLIIATIFFVIALVVRRKDAFQFRWLPTFEPGSLSARLIHYGLIYIVCGFAIPWGYTLLVERETPAALGLKRERWVTSLILSLVVASLFTPIIIFEGNLGAIGWVQVAKASFVLTGAGGLFELFLYYGFIHLRLEKAFGTIPAILVTAAIYVLWHVGTQLPLEADPLAALWKLLLVGVMSQAALLPRRGRDARFRGQHWRSGRDKPRIPLGGRHGGLDGRHRRGPGLGRPTAVQGEPAVN
jgi:membrane protease YdiL (CAAX protease family)